MNSMTTTINNLSPHYTNQRFKHPQLIWGSKDTDKWEYSDRLSEWDYKKHCQAWEQASEEHDIKTAAFFQKYMQLYFDDPNLELVGIMSGWNWGNGYPYRIYGYRTKED